MFGLLWLRHDVIVGMWHTSIPSTTTQLSPPHKQKHTQLSQDYSEEFRDIGGVKGKGKAQLPEGAITLINQRIVTDDLPVISNPSTWIRIRSLDHETLQKESKQNTHNSIITLLP